MKDYVCSKQIMKVLGMEWRCHASERIGRVVCVYLHQPAMAIHG